MTLLARAWIGAARARRRLSSDGPADDPMGLLRSLVPGRSVVDVGCMWSVDGAYCFAAEEAGATAVTGVDLMPASGRFEAERERRGSAVITPSALRGMLSASAFGVELRLAPFLATAIARPE
jgi:hypothetical protein